MAKAPSRSRGKTAPGKSSPRGKGKGKSGGSPKAKVSRPAPRPKSTKGGLPIICSECYSDFHLTSTAPGTKITCPECMHLGSIDEGDVIAQVSIAKKAEKQSLIIAMIGVFLMVGLFFAYQMPLISEGTIESGMHWGLAGGIGVAFLVAVIFGIKYEKNRHEVYF